MAEQLEAIGAEFTLMTTRKFIEELDGTPLKISHLKSRVEDINGRINDELSRTKFYFVEVHSEYLDSSTPLFGADVATKFANASFDIEEAGKSLALGLTTAAVFHSMRILEIGIKATMNSLSLPAPTRDADRNWGNMLRKIKEEIDGRNKSKPPKWKNASDKDFFEEIHASLDAVRNVWRNATMHVEKKYTPSEADHIFSAVRGFMMKLSFRCDEQGLPLA